MIEAGHDVSISGGMFTLVNGSYTQVNHDGRDSGTLLDFASFEAPYLLADLWDIRN